MDTTDEEQTEPAHLLNLPPQLGLLTLLEVLRLQSDVVHPKIHKVITRDALARDVIRRSMCNVSGQLHRLLDW